MGAWTRRGRSSRLVLVPAILGAAGCGGSGGGGGGQPAAEAVVIEVAGLTVREPDSGETGVRFEVRLSRAAEEEVRVSYSFASESAASGADFAGQGGVLEFAPGETRGTIAARVRGDRLDEPDESFAVVLSSPVNAALGKARAVAVITDQDPPPAIEVHGGTWTERSAGGTARFAVELSAPSGKTVEVEYATRDGEAKQGKDYDRATGTIRLAPGEVAKEIPVRLRHDGEAEPDEDFFLELDDPENASLDEDTATATILDVADAPGGLDERPVEAACQFSARPQPAAGVMLKPAFTRLWQTGHLEEAVGLLQAPGDASRWFAVLRRGRVRAFDNRDDVRVSSLVLDLSNRVTTAREGGLLGMAFHPAFPANGRAFLFYTTPSHPMATVISGFRSRDGGQTFDPSSEEVLIHLENRKDFHKGGHLAFGPDGFLYTAIGDDGTGANAQDLDVFPGKFLRLDVDRASPYAIPPDNPFASGGGLPEIYAWGLRNPWRWSFDRATGDLWLGDVGQVRWEEIDRVVKGGNYGWPYREGSSCYLPSHCRTAGLTDPVHEWSHDEGGSAAIGGYVYRGKALSQLQGAYIYGDWGWQRVLALVPEGGGYTRRVLAELPAHLFSFAEDATGEILVLAGGRRIYRLSPVIPGGGEVLPQRLSELPCLDPGDPRRPAPGLIPYDVNVPFWSDGATKERWLALPANTTIAIDPSGDWDLPVGAVAVKHFRLAGKLIETRVLARHADGAWAGYTYEWNDAGTDAELLALGKTKQVGSRTWTFPSRAQCLACHTDAAGGTLGFETLQMNRTFTYVRTGRRRNQITTFNELGLFSRSPGDPDRLPRLPRLDGDDPVEERARAYLHANCSHCHRPGGTGRGPADLRFDAGAGEMNICNVSPLTVDPAHPGARLLVPGDPGDSLLLLRMETDGTTRMPPIGRNSEDAEGSELIADWIDSLDECP